MQHTLPTLAQLKAQYVGQYVSYQNLLGTQEWREKRNTIVERDGIKCTKCNCVSTTNMLINDKYYYITNMPDNMYVSMYNEDGVLYVSEGDEFTELIYVEKPVVLHVHHLYYEKSRYPWEYPDEALATLCSDCHLEVHRKEIIPVYVIESGNRIKLSTKTCSRCNGAGYFPQYNHVEAGICFACRGSRYTNLEL